MTQDKEKNHKHNVILQNARLVNKDTNETIIDCTLASIDMDKPLSNNDYESIVYNMTDIENDK